MQLETQLKQFGLHRSEIKVYLYLVEHGLTTPPKLARGTGIARTNCYHILQDLIAKRLVTEESIGKRKAYVATDPESLLLTLEEKRLAATQLIPDLRALFISQKNKPKIRFFEGLEQLQEIYRASLTGREIFALQSTPALADVAPELYRWYAKEIEKRAIAFYEIISLSKNISDQPTSILVWNDTVAIITLAEPAFGTLIINSSIAHTWRTVLQILREKL